MRYAHAGEETNITFEIDTGDLDEMETVRVVLQLDIVSMDLGEHARSLEEPEHLQLAEHRPDAEDKHRKGGD
ncbi:hypothetical protein LRD18_10420 [Halorhodospira halochloris]|uniref:hypothetical protein n=1 Tax=Halorhodospira halochloris TaxID=1052 RepID=UPI001EE8C9F1|nr:hypothetical protein [Halorhodospira halochloris]MCG5531269.1 hypothetical protein [Halorhodospira halochloris]